MNEAEIIITEDGSHTLLNKALDETYHSIHGAIQESQHVFIDKGFDFFKARTDVSDINILEIGFGTGLNALLTCMQANDSKNIHYTTLEAFPLEEKTWSVLNYADKLGNKDYFNLLHSVSWDTWHALMPGFSLLKINNTLQQVALPKNVFDIIYFDAFAPSKQPDMWTLPMLKKIADNMKSGGVFVTYCAKGQLKRDLKNIGLTVETLEGPPGKKEMVRGVK